MTAAIRTNRAAPITVARGGHEGAPIQVTPSFSSRKAFGVSQEESRYGKAFSIGRPNPLVRTISIGEQPRMLGNKATQFTSPERARVMDKIKISVPHTGSSLALYTPQRSEIATTSSNREIAKVQSKETPKATRAVTLFENPRLTAPKKEIKELAIATIANRALTTPHIKELAPVAKKSIDALPKVTALIKPEVKKEVTPITTKKSKALSEIGLSLALKEKTPTVTKKVSIAEIGQAIVREPVQTLKEKEAQVTHVSLERVRQDLKEVTKKPALTIAKPVEVIPSVPVSITRPQKETRRLTPIEKVAEKTQKKDVVTTKARVIQAKKDEVIRIKTSFDTPSEHDKILDKALLTTYVNTFILTNHKEAKVSPAQQAKQKEVAKRMAEHMTNPAHRDQGSQLEAQILGDTTSSLENIAIGKVTSLVKEARAAIQLAKIYETNPEKAERKALMKLHMKIKQAGLIDVFTKVKTTVAQEILKDTVTNPKLEQTSEDPEKQPTEQQVVRELDEDETTSETDMSAHVPFKVELDTFADRFRRMFMKSRAQRAFDKAKEKGFKQVTTTEIANEIGTYQYQFIKSQPVRYTTRQDGSITETLAELKEENTLVHSMDEAATMLDAKIDKNAPVRLARKIKTKARGFIDFLRVMGAFDALDEIANRQLKQPKKMISTQAAA